MSSASQILPSLVVSIMEIAIKNLNTSSHLILKPWQYRHIINLANDVDSLVQICNSRKRFHDNTGLFTPESGLEMQNNLLVFLSILIFGILRLRKKRNIDNWCLPNQRWKSI